jgi:hypothetical protein
MTRPVPSQVVDSEWIEFPGGELEGNRPKGLCQACRARLKTLAESPAPRGVAGGARQPLCFQCYRVELDRNHALRAAGQLNTASEERFQSALPFEPVDHARLERLRTDRLAARAAFLSGTGQFIDKRRQAQIAARHALQRIAADLQVRDASGGRVTSESERLKSLAAAAHAAELQLPDAWLPFVMAR